MSSSEASTAGDDSIDYDFAGNHVPGERPRAAEVIECVRFIPIFVPPSPPRVPSSHPTIQVSQSVKPTHRLIFYSRNSSTEYTCNFDPATSALSDITPYDNLPQDRANELLGKEPLDQPLDPTAEPWCSMDEHIQLRFSTEADENGNRYLQCRVSSDESGSGFNRVTLLGKRTVVSTPAAPVPTDALNRLGLWNGAGEDAEDQDEDQENKQGKRT